MSQVHNTVFISYRRDVASFIARAVFLELRTHGYDVFMDVESIDSGTFDTIILNQIAARAHFLLILTPGSLERCAEPGDWLRLEIEEAMRLNRNIVPLLINNFDLYSSKPYLTGALEDLTRFNAVNVPHDYFEAAMERVRTRFLKMPVAANIEPTPPADVPIVDEKIEELLEQPAPTEQELDAEEYFNRALQKYGGGDLEGAIEDNTRAMQLKADYAAAYLNRGNAHYDQDDLTAAIEDYDFAITLKPDYAAAYVNRGLARYDQGNLTAAIQDYDHAITLKPDYAAAYVNRGLVRHYQDDLTGAIQDYDYAIQLYPNDDAAYLNRGNAHYEIGDLTAAVQDYNLAIKLRPDETAYNNRGEAYFSAQNYQAAYEDFRKALHLAPSSIIALAGLSITQHAVGNEQEALRIWREALLPQGVLYRDADRLGNLFSWRPELVEEARKLIAKL
jgi:tetratricopeptide (TPR) repeat protein